MNFFGILIASVTVALYQVTGTNGQEGFCDRPCFGGPRDRCLDCATACTKTCDQPNGPDACIQACIPNTCQCDDGFVRAPNGQCIRPSQCGRNSTTTPCTSVEPQCPFCSGSRNDRCVGCGTTCPATCDNPWPGACTRDCALNVCRCARGFVRGPKGDCIRRWQCPSYK